jgi:threonine dehydratase
MVLVDEPAIARAMRWLIEEHHLIAEGSAAVPLAALLEQQISDLVGQRVVVLICGRNVAATTLQQIFAIPSKD